MILALHILSTVVAIALITASCAAMAAEFKRYGRKMLAALEHRP
ncbi:hypothetical protein [Sphingobium yanoikuyae]|nr:hypothetical protein [Sphingobium yanoikuyae]WBQ17504.1 hypothetical protein PAE53_04665 [Sphingobium yanoikuyae]